MIPSEMILKYGQPAPDGNDYSEYACKDNAWESYSLPVGNGYFGANIFGRTMTERIQISEPSLSNPYYRSETLPSKGGAACCGMNSFAEILIDIGHTSVSDYERSLSLEDATAYVSYKCGGIQYKRDIFASHPDKVLVVRFSSDADAAISIGLHIKLPFLGEYTIEPGDGFSKTGSVKVDNGQLIIDGRMDYYGIEYYGITKVVCKSGHLFTDEAGIRVENADEVILLFTCDTNYELSEKVIWEKDPKKKLCGKKVNKEKCQMVVQNASERSFCELKQRHVEDYRSLYARTTICLGEEEETRYTDKLLLDHKNGKRSLYLETLLFQYGRYLLIASSRSRLPAHLQGIWNAYCDSPWSCGYWHNINVQMNYWLSGPANISDTFIPYINYAKAYMKAAKENADQYIKENYPWNYSADGENGWIVWVACWAYSLKQEKKPRHSGPGTGAFTALLFWDYYDYTRDLSFLREFGYPALRDMSLFFTKVLTKRGGKYLVEFSASPEVRHNKQYYLTTGCAFDQQMVYENFSRTIEAAQILGIKDDFILKLKRILPNLDPVIIGCEGQVKEYREETTYASIGDDPNHRHISHLVGLYPATIINDNTPEWLDAAKVTLTKRGDYSTGWAVAHRLLLWARVKDGNKCENLIDSFIRRNLADNLWCLCPPFQIDGNLGYTAGVCEMLLQSHAGYLDLLPAIPDNWINGAFKGLKARGNFTVDCTWQNRVITCIKITSGSGGLLRIKLPTYLSPDSEFSNNGLYEALTVPGEVIILNNRNSDIL